MYIHFVLGSNVLDACVCYIFTFVFVQQLSIFHMKKCYKNKIIIIIIIIVITIIVIIVSIKWIYLLYRVHPSGHHVSFNGFCNYT